MAFFSVKPVALQVVLTLPQHRLHYLLRLLPIPPTYKLNGSSFGRQDVDLMHQGVLATKVGYFGVKSAKVYLGTDGHLIC